MNFSLHIWVWKVLTHKFSQVYQVASLDRNIWIWSVQLEVSLKTWETNLIDCTWNQTWQIFASFQTSRKRRAKARSGLNRRKRNFANAIRLGEAEYVANLIQVNTFLNSTYVFVETWCMSSINIRLFKLEDYRNLLYMRIVPHIIEITEYECLVYVESARYDIFGVFVCQSIRLFYAQIFP